MDKVQDVNITSAEWRIMRVVWTLKTTTSHEITEILGDSMGWKSATIKTLLRRLVDKNILRAQKQGNKFIYSAIMPETNTIETATKQFFDQLCAQKVGSAIADLIAESNLTAEDVNKIQTQLNQKQPVESVECDCIPDQDCNC